jgi:hypothetical protein
MAEAYWVVNYSKRGSESQHRSRRDLEDLRFCCSRKWAHRELRWIKKSDVQQNFRVLSEVSCELLKMVE